MLFNSISFGVFFPVVFLLYYFLTPKLRSLFLLAASCFFYMCFVPEYILILFALITADFFFAKKMYPKEGKERALFLVLSILFNVGILIFFRYFNFLNENIASLADFLNWNYTPLLLEIALPLGLSFHVFQSLSYVIEVYKKKVTPEKSYLTYALYVMFFPQLVAGPIERPGHLLPQLSVTHSFDGKKVRQGLEQMLWGFFKKIVIADQIAQIINPLYADLPSESPLLWIIAFLFLYQLYCDFSGYSDIAIGSARMLGYDLAINFNRPFAARTLQDFWNRWHISLSSWLRDYLYYPLALGWGKRTKVKLYFSLVLTFVIIGLWHGANWTFAVFGLLHGLYLLFEVITEGARRNIRNILHVEKYPFFHHAFQTILIFCFASITFVFFRSETVAKAWWFVTHMFTAPDVRFILNDLVPTLVSSVGMVVFLGLLLAIVCMEVVQYLQSRKGTFYIFDEQKKTIRYAWYYGLSVYILFFGYFGGESFIYFQF